MHTIEQQPLVGVVGLGNLGEQLVEQIHKAGMAVLAFDSDPMPMQTFGDDPRRRVARTLAEVLHTCNAVHWAVPSRAVVDIAELPVGRLVLLHDSVMAESERAIAGRSDRHRFAIVHWLMNEANSVAVAAGPSQAAAANHFMDIDLQPFSTGVEEHDALRSVGQGMLGLLIEHCLPLLEQAKSGNLAPSEQRLLAFLLAQQREWTGTTLDAVQCNPALVEVANQMKEMMAGFSQELQQI